MAGSSSAAVQLGCVYTYTYKYILTHVTKCENFQCLKGDKNLRSQLSNHCFPDSNDQFFEVSETHLPYSQTQMTNFQGGSESHITGSRTQMTSFWEGSDSQMH